jgi:cell division protein FtsW (lipid II flippase)
MLIIGLAVGLIAAEPNISTALFILLLGLAVMVAAGTS